MTSAAYVSAIQGMQGLLPPMIEHLVSLADRLTPGQRAKAVADLTGYNSELVSNREEASALYQEGTKTVQHALRVEIPKLRKAQEKSQQKADVKKADTNLQNL